MPNIGVTMDTPKSENDWRAEGDAHTLANAREIEADGPRLAKARAAAHRKVMEMARVAGQPTARPEDTAGGLRRIPNA